LLSPSPKKLREHEAALDRFLVITDPPAMGAARQRYFGLANTAFLHEQPGFVRQASTTAQQFSSV
jgi:hypothetical protein